MEMKFWPKPNYNVTFNRDDGERVGELDFNGPEMKFTGNAEESAKIFFDWIAKSFTARLEQERASVVPEARWIPVSERLPEGNMPVALVEPGATWAGDAKPDLGVLSWGIFKGGKFLVDHPPAYEAKPSHWMPVPPLPQGEDDDGSFTGDEWS